MHSTVSPQAWESRNATKIHAGLDTHTGLGATCSPFVSTLFVEHYPNRFYFYYIVSLALTIVNNVWCVLVYRFRTADEVLGPEPVEQVKNESGEYEALAEQTSGEKMKRIMKLPRTWAIACHLLAYVGLEVTIGECQAILL